MYGETNGGRQSLGRVGKKAGRRKVRAERKIMCAGRKRERDHGDNIKTD